MYADVCRFSTITPFSSFKNILTTTLVTYVNIDLYDKTKFQLQLKLIQNQDLLFPFRLDFTHNEQILLNIDSYISSKLVLWWIFQGHFNEFFVTYKHESDLYSSISNQEETRHNNFLSHQFQINHQLCILRHAYPHKTSNYETILNNNKVLINLLSLRIFYESNVFKIMILRTLATIAKRTFRLSVMIYQSHR